MHKLQNKPSLPEGHHSLPWFHPITSYASHAESVLLRLQPVKPGRMLQLRTNCEIISTLYNLRRNPFLQIERLYRLGVHWRANVRAHADRGVTKLESDAHWSPGSREPLISGPRSATKWGCWLAGPRPRDRELHHVQVGHRHRYVLTPEARHNGRLSRGGGRRSWSATATPLRDAWSRCGRAGCRSGRLGSVATVVSLRQWRAFSCAMIRETASASQG